MQKKMNKHGMTIAELLVAASISIIVIGVAFALWFMTQGVWVNERIKSELLQDLQISVERIKREMQMSDGGKIFFHTADNGVYDAISFPLAMDDGRSNAGYSPIEDGNGFIETDSSTLDPITGVAKIFWDQTVIYHICQNGGKYELRRTIFYPRDNSLSATERQQQIDRVVALGTGNDAAVPEFTGWQSTRTLLKAKSLSFETSPQLREFDGYSSITAKTEDMIDFGSVILTGGYHDIKFKAVKKNSASSGYALGIDALKFTPAGGIQDGEHYANTAYPDGSSGITASSGDTLSVVNMHNSLYGVWSNDYYLDYAANAVNDYLTLHFYYDTWHDTTFLDGISNDVKVEFSNRNGNQDNVSGSEEYILRLAGYDITWDAYKQARQGGSVLPAGYESVSDKTYRIVLANEYIQHNGMMLRIKFRAHESQQLKIESAYITQQSSEAGDDPYDGSTQTAYKQITFRDPPAAGVTIGAGAAEWSNWAQMQDTGIPPADLPLDETNNYIVTFYVSDPSALVYWEDTNTSDDPMSYTRNGAAAAGEVNWPPPGPSITEERRIYVAEEVQVTYVKNGDYISQVFDTGIEDPAFTKMQYTAIANNDASLAIRVRSDDDKPTLEADSDWAVIPGITLSGNPGDISAVSGGRYVQFKADFAAISGGVTPESYDQSCILKDVSVYWPGNTTMVDVGGYFTKNPGYGIFTIEVDGQKLTKGFEVNLAIDEDISTGAAVSRSITTEVEPRNTGK